MPMPNDPTKDLLLSAVQQEARKRFEADIENYYANADKLKANVPLTEIDSKERVAKRIARLKDDAKRNGRIRKERVLGSNDFFHVNYLERGLLASRSVGRVSIRTSKTAVEGHGTGFLIAPGVMITNNHVISSKAKAKHSLLEMNYQYDINGKLLAVEYFDLLPEKLYLTHKKLDFTIVAVKPVSQSGAALSSFGILPLIAEVGKVVLGEYLTVIQHPDEQPKQLAVRENQFISIDDDFLRYRTDTAEGSSGSPVFNDQWEVVAVHHSSHSEQNSKGQVLLTDGTIYRSEADWDRINWIANEGTRVSRIVQIIKAATFAKPEAKALVKGILDPVPLPPLPVLERSNNAAANDPQAITITLQVEANGRPIKVNVNG